MYSFIMNVPHKKTCFEKTALSSDPDHDHDLRSAEHCFQTVQQFFPASVFARITEFREAQEDAEVGAHQPQ